MADSDFPSQDGFTYYIAVSPSDPLTDEVQSNLRDGLSEWLDRTHGPRDRVHSYEVHDQGFFAVFTVGGLSTALKAYRDSVINVATTASNRAAITDERHAVSWRLHADSWMGTLTEPELDSDLAVLRDLVTPEGFEPADADTPALSEG